MTGNIYSIYKVVNTVNGKVYIGFDSQWPRRMNDHIHAAERGSQNLLHRAIRAHGLDAFAWEVICQSKNGKHLLQEMEPYFIREYNSFHQNKQGYNMTLGGEGTLGYKVTDEAKKKMSVAKRGKKLSPEHVEKREQSRAITRAIAKANDPNYGKGRRVSPETIEKIKLSNAGRKHSPETKEKIRQALIGQKISFEAKEKMRQAKLGKKRTRESVEKMRQVNTGRKRVYRADGTHCYVYPDQQVMTNV